MDWIVKADGTGADILIDAGGANTPSWSVHAEDPTRYRPALDPGDIDVPTPHPPPVSDDDTPELTALTLRVEEQERRLRHILAQQLSILDRLRIVETAPAPVPLPDQEYIAEGQTSRVWGHGHSFSVRVRKA